MQLAVALTELIYNILEIHCYFFYFTILKKIIYWFIFSSVLHPVGYLHAL